MLELPFYELLILFYHQIDISHTLSIIEHIFVHQTFWVLKRLLLVGLI